MLVVGLVGAGCGADDGSSEVPTGAVAVVGDVPITKAAYDKMRPATLVANPDPRLAEVAALQILLQREWTKQEAAAQTVTVSDAAVKRALREQRAQFFKKESQYQNYLRRTRRTEADLYAGMQQKLLMDKLTARAVRKSPPIDEKRVAEYYDAHKKEFALPDRYEVHTLIAKTQANANQAKQAIADGTSWKQATGTYAVEGAQTAASSQAHVLASTGVKELDTALAKTKAGERIVIKTQYGWILVGVERVLAAKQLALGQAKAQIRSRLLGSRKEDAINAYLQDFQQEYKGKSLCAESYKVAECSNGPAENPQPKPPSEQRPSPTNPGAGADK